MCNYSNKPVPLKKEVMPLPPKFDISEKHVDIATPKDMCPQIKLSYK